MGGPVFGRYSMRGMQVPQPTRAITTPQSLGPNRSLASLFNAHSMQERSSPWSTSKHPWSHTSGTSPLQLMGLQPWWKPTHLKTYSLGGPSPASQSTSRPGWGVRVGAPPCWELTCPVASGLQTSAGQERHSHFPSWRPLLSTCSWWLPVAQPCLASSCSSLHAYPLPSCTLFQVGTGEET